MPTSAFRWERDFWRSGYELVAGVDEVGRGALAGPLVAAAVIFETAAADHRPTRQRLQATIHDSKVMSRQSRQTALLLIQRTARCIGIGMVECSEIDELGMSAANRLAMERAVFDLDFSPAALLLDAFVTDLDMPQVGLIDGDALCLSIAAASIVAKVTRDGMMCALHETDSRYGLDQHVGYGTPDHLRALREHGAASFHRRSFRPVQECLIHP